MGRAQSSCESAHYIQSYQAELSALIISVSSVPAISSGLTEKGGRHVEGDRGPMWEGLASDWGQDLELFKIIQKYL